MSWSADIINDPDRDFDLYVELMLDDEYVARLQRNAEGVLELKFYGGRPVTMSIDWVLGLAKRFEADVPSDRG